MWWRRLYSNSHGCLPCGNKTVRADCCFSTVYTLMPYNRLDDLWRCVCLVAQCSHDGVHLVRWTQCNQIRFCFWARIRSHTFMSALYTCTLMSCLIKSMVLHIKGSWFLSEMIDIVKKALHGKPSWGHFVFTSLLWILGKTISCMFFSVNVC